MNVFSLHSSVIQDYKEYINSFVRIDDARIKQHVTNALESGKLWKPPLIQFNPAFKGGASVKSLVDEGVLHPELGHVFKGYSLYEHQVQAIKLGSQNKGFVVTSGTGSGKSLTFIGTVFNYLFKNNGSLEAGVKAIIIYPMNALINSQFNELTGYANYYEQATGKPFPITFGQYTGQEKEQARHQMQQDPPDILLTNYMMLELLLTRTNDGEPRLRQSIYNNLRFLAFDELHTFRGRQGADVALLTRRLINHAKNPVTCIGTSATMVSGGSFGAQKKQIARVASSFFGKPFGEDQIIHEALEYSINPDVQATANELKTLINNGLSLIDDIELIRRHPLAAWLEREVALRSHENQPVRNKPLTIEAIVEKLAVYTECPENAVSSALEVLLASISLANVKAKEKKQKAVLPFKLHQFISQTGSVYMTLDGGSISLEASYFANRSENQKTPLFPIVFSRESGVAFYCLNRQKSMLTPREFTDTLEDSDNQEDERGYLIIREVDEEGRDKIWNDDEIDNLPDAWVNRDATGKATSVVRAHRGSIPRRIYFDVAGNYDFEASESLPLTGWFLPYKLPFDPTSGTIYDRFTSEGRKLTKLGSEGRSTSTTVLSFALLKQLARNGYDYENQKVLSFTDNRQDAALQAGHFNDFINTIQIRAAIYRAVLESTNKQLDYSRIADQVVATLQLPQEDYAATPASFPGPKRENEQALRDYLMFRILEDLKRSWRIVLPNLEQCGLLKIRYKYLDESCVEDTLWQNVPLLESLTAKKRSEVVFQILDYFRKFYAIRYDEYLSQGNLDAKRAQILQKLKKPWGFDEREQPQAPNSLRPTTSNPHGRDRGFIQSIAYSSAFGKYIRRLFRNGNLGTLRQDSYEQAILSILNKLVEAGWLYRVPTNSDQFPLYRLNIDNVVWQLGDEQTVDIDLIKNPSYKITDKSPNLFFQEVYKTDFRRFKKLSAEDHTGQITSSETRKEREEAFRKGNLSALYCSPTMELGIDISSLDVVHMRNVPPSPANYAQRSGRAGRNGQAALVFTYCSSYSPHDKHYYRNEIDMVAGVVTPPQIDLTNEDLLRGHLHAIYLAEVGMHELNRSVMAILDEQKPGLPLLAAIQEKIDISPDRKAKVIHAFTRVLDDFASSLGQKFWFTQDWVTIQVNQFLVNFDRSFNRWRKLYSDAHRQLQSSTQTIQCGLYTVGSSEFKEAQREQRFAQRQLDLLKNEVREPNYISEFYPFRYLASEGFLPGYDFTRLPLRTFLEGAGGTGEFVSRPRSLALREFGPRNVIYHSGTKYEVKQLRISDIETARTKAKVSLRTGYFLDGDDYERDVCPFSGDPLTNDSQRRLYVNLLEMTETRSQQRDRITCEEEERLKQGYRMATFFSIPAGMASVERATLAEDNTLGTHLLNIQYIPAARLIHVNEGWRNQSRQGFRLNQFGGWVSTTAATPSTQATYDVQLYSYTNADALYIQPVSSLNLTPAGITTLQYALKRAIEIEYQIESSELGVQLMGNHDNPNVFLFESAEGSLGILSQLVSDKAAFHRVVRTAFALCRFDDPDYLAPASYDDLLSYYNQRDHQAIDRFLIKEALERMLAARVEIYTNKQFDSYDDQYRLLLTQYDTNSTLERVFLDYLYANNLRLPDKAQERVDGIYSQPDFWYQPDIHIFIDGSVHDSPDQKDHDRRVRQAIKNRGQQVWVYRYDQNLPEQISKRSDIFIKVR